MAKQETRAEAARAGRINNAIDSACESMDEALGEVLADIFPEATTGDVDPAVGFEYDQQLRAAVEPLIRHWVECNCPQLR